MSRIAFKGKAGVWLVPGGRWGWEGQGWEIGAT